MKGYTFWVYQGQINLPLYAEGISPEDAFTRTEAVRKSAKDIIAVECEEGEITNFAELLQEQLIYQS